MRGLLLGLALGLVGLGLANCAATEAPGKGEYPQIGLCMLPPEKHEGTYRYACWTENGEMDAWCDYVDTERKCLYRMSTKDCFNWTFDGKQCVGDAQAIP